ncbi:hypothetical protein Dimus_038720 [Dionaea muscipula]
MWSYDSARSRNSRVRSVVERMFREGMGSEEQDMRPDVPDCAVAVAPHEDFVSIEVLPDLKTSGSALTMAEPLCEQPLGLPDERGCEVVSSQSVVSFGHSGDNCSEIVVADLTANHVTDPVICGSPATRSADGKEIHSIAEVPDASLVFPCLTVSVSSSPRFAGLLGADAQVHGSDEGRGLLPVDLVNPGSGGGQVMGVGVDGLLNDGLGELMADDHGGFCLITEASSLEIDDSGEGGTGRDDVVMPSDSGCSFLHTDSGFSSQPSVFSVLVSDEVPHANEFVRVGRDDMVKGGGMVSEEVAVSPEAGAAMRPQPTDGLRQPPLSPVEPALMDGHEPSRTYAHVVLPDRRADVELCYCPPDDGGNFITMAESDGDAERWGSSLVGYFLQGSLPFGYVRSSVSGLWRKAGLTDVKSLDDGFFVFSFADSLSRDAVLEGGPWFVGGKPLLLRKWECLLSLTKETLTRIPVWASFYNVPLEYWTAAGLSRIASVIGRPLHLDRYTATRERLSYARVCIEVDAAGPCHREVRLRCGDKEALVRVKFDWFPARCEMCRVFGHATSGCPTQPRPAPPLQPMLSESAPTGLRTPSRGTRMTGGVGTVEEKTDDLGWRVSQRRGRPPTTTVVAGCAGAESSGDRVQCGRDGLVVQPSGETSRFAPLADLDEQDLHDLGPESGPVAQMAATTLVEEVLSDTGEMRGERVSGGRGKHRVRGRGGRRGRGGLQGRGRS